MSLLFLDNYSLPERVYPGVQVYFKRLFKGRIGKGPRIYIVFIYIKKLIVYINVRFTDVNNPLI